MEQIAFVDETREVVDATDRRRYELRESGDVVATLDYRTVGKRRVLGHTEVAQERRGQGLAATLIGAVLDRLLADHTSITNYCPVVRTYIGRHPEYLPIVDRAHPGNIELTD
jgi:predicted GNAT family acetyltransferase